jgi:cell division septal protein FtsQ
MKNISQIRISKNAFVLFLILFFSVAVFFADRADFFSVRQIQIKSLDRDLYTLAQVQKLHEKMKRFGGHKIWEVPLFEIKKILVDEKWISDFKINRQLPNNITVEIQASDVLAVYVSSKGVVIPLNSKAQLLPPIEVSKAPVAPVVRDASLLKDISLQKKTAALLSQLPKEGPLSINTIDEIKIDKSKNIWLEMIHKGISIRTGENDISIKVARIEKVLNYLDSESLTDRVIDAEFGEKVLVRPRKRR